MTLKEKEICYISKKEKEFINKKPSSVLKQERDMALNIIKDKLPQKVFMTTEAVFESAFDFIFDEGLDLIEKTYSKEKILNEYIENKNNFNKEKTLKNLRKFDNCLKSSNAISIISTGIKSTALGIVGVGMPDIPIFIAEILRVIYKTALSYGYRYENDREKIYILSIIAFSISYGEDRVLYSKLCDDIAKCIDNKTDIKVSLKDMEEKVSGILAKRICGVKVVQGIMILGALSSVSNVSIMNDVSYGAFLKYKKRFLNYKLLDKK